MAVSIEKVYRSKRNNTNTANIILADLLCDTASDLPSQSGLTGYILDQGCKADVIDENRTYKIDSSGNWHVSGGEMWQNVYTKSEVDGLLDDKQDELTTAQLDAVNSGITATILQELQSYHNITSIPSNSDLDDYKQVGHFKVTSSTVASSIVNTPFTSAGYILDIDYWYQVLSGTTGYVQTALTNSANRLIEKKRIYQYQNNTWSWTPWVTTYTINIPT